MDRKPALPPVLKRVLIGSVAGLAVTAAWAATETGTLAFLGAGAGAANSGSNNVFVGVQAGTTNTNGGNNTAVGAYAGHDNTSGTANTFLGISAGYANTSGNKNTFVGVDAGRFTTVGFENTYIGKEAGYSNTTGAYSTFIGSGAGHNDVGTGGNTFVGAFSGSKNSVGAFNAAFGANAGVENVNGSFNAYFGHSAAQQGFGSRNAVFGAQAGLTGSTSNDVAFFGFRAGTNNAASDNAFFGSEAGLNNEGGTRNAYFGRGAGRGTGIVNGSDNAFVGYNAGFAIVGGLDNAFFGSEAGRDTVSGQRNAFVGRMAGAANTGSLNTFLGAYAGKDNTTGATNTAIGAYSNVSTSLPNATAIGFQAQASATNTLVLGSIPGTNEPVGANSYVAVGMGTDAPGFPLHIKRADTTENMLRIEQSSDTLKDRALMLLSNKGGTRFEFQNTSTAKAWRFQAMTGAQNNFEISDVDSGTGVIELRLTEVGNLIIAGTLTQNSNVHDKTGIVPVSGEALLDKVRKLPISEWRYKNDAETPHVGPMAQDFYAAFKLGSDETKIAPGDMAGIALAAIQAQEREITRLRAENDDEIARLKAEHRADRERLEAELLAMHHELQAVARSVAARDRADDTVLAQSHQR